MSRSWEELAKNATERLNRTADAIGVRCATDFCGVTRGITYEKPLCYGHWKEFDRYFSALGRPWENWTILISRPAARGTSGS